MINVAKDFDAAGDGITNDQPAISKAIDAAHEVGGDTVFFPKGVYYLQKPVSCSGLRYIKLTGEEATILCQGKEGIPNSIGQGGGMKLAGDHITIENLRFEGYIVSEYTSNYGYGRLLRLSGNYHLVQNCYFKGGNAGGVEIFGGTYNIVTQNIFDTCNNYPPEPHTGDYGAIHLAGSCKFNTISENRIFGHRYAGISGYGTSQKNDFTNLYIKNNYIKSASASRPDNHSMGIYLLNGANNNIEISGNTIENADAECIIIFSEKSSPAQGCKIINNVLFNGAYQGLALRSQHEGGTFTNTVIRGNFIENTLLTTGYHHQIFLERFEDGLITNNTLKGYSPRNGAGIYLYQNPVRNTISHNIIERNKIGITFYGRESTLDSNTIINCGKGIRFAHCEGSTAINNFVRNSKIPVDYAIDKALIQTSGNVF